MRERFFYLDERYYSSLPDQEHQGIEGHRVGVGRLSVGVIASYVVVINRSCDNSNTV